MEEEAVSDFKTCEISLCCWSDSIGLEDTLCKKEENECGENDEEELEILNSIFWRVSKVMKHSRSWDL